MEYKNNLIFSEPYYKLIQDESIVSIELYHKFINWTSGEFDLYLQEEYLGLKVYVPNGWFSIKSIGDVKEEIYIQIKVVNKSKKVCKKLMNRLQDIYNHVLSVYEYSISKKNSLQDLNRSI